MHRFLSFLRLLPKMAAAALLTVILLSLFCFGYSRPSFGVEDPAHATDFKWYPAGYEAHMTEGHAFKKADANGYYNLSADQADHPEILLLGSSHMEALQIPTACSVGSLLNEERKTYNIAVSGHFLDQIAPRMPAALDTYRPSQFVILDIADYAISRESMLDFLEGDAPSEDNLCLYDTLNPLGQKLYKNLFLCFPAVPNILKSIRDWSSRDTAEPAAPEEVSRYTPEYMELYSRFMKKLADTVHSTGAELIIFTHTNYAVDEHGHLCRSADNLDYCRHLETVCRENGIVFVDMYAPIRELYEEQGVLAYGFCNTSAGKGHLNKAGHRVVADTLLEVIHTLESSPD